MSTVNHDIRYVTATCSQCGHSHTQRETQPVATRIANCRNCGATVHTLTPNVPALAASPAENSNGGTDNQNGN